MDELRILIARLGWPSTTARWWAMQELAACLGRSTAEAEAALIQLLKSCRLEAEVIEILCIFWIAARSNGYKAPAQLGESIQRSSILADLLLDSLGVCKPLGDSNLIEVPVDFDIPQDFEDVQGSDLPRIFRTTMINLEYQTGLPFLQQMAFEWTLNHSVYPEAPFQGNLGHFIRPLGEGFVGHLSSRTALRSISAYLRTIAVATECWGIPMPSAVDRALLALPIHPTLAFLTPQRPQWFPQATDFEGDSALIQASLQEMLMQVKAEEGGELIAFASPIVISRERCVEVSCVRWSQAVGSSIADEDLALHLDDYWHYRPGIRSSALEPLGVSTLLSLPGGFNSILDGESKAWPLSAPLDFDRIGYLQHDLYPERLMMPTLPGKDGAELSPHHGRLVIKDREQVVASLCYWNAGWGVARPTQFGGHCGSALISRGTSYREGAIFETPGVRSIYLWKVRTLSRHNSFGSFDETITMGALFV
ncbi:multidrug DMT transporter permease [Pseudomonas putida CSV86]|uniref:Multidrug DMT transporter permease n=4 Tax=Pseudomonas TaxID=286 RepID=A0A7W2LZA4_9PSED|nr:multidrug DMT transporter permease [Pseudomonas juntendi]MBA6149616.1 multidrug DMT transporter permease [Pseudomonas juntendi]NNJ14742.1 multidrug DMT transporter permease [Pseudomonas bharatica CSV86]